MKQPDDVMPSALIASTPLVGREREQSLLRAALDATLDGRGSIVLISGEAGIGKTTLAEMLCREATERGARVLVGRCYDLTETPPYGPWVELFAHYRAADGDPSLPAAFALRGTVGKVTSQTALFEQVRDFLITLATQRPLVFVFDDLHWADPASLDLLRSLARSLMMLPLVIVATYRVDELTRRHPLYTLLPIITREAHAARLDLRPLTESDLRELIETRYSLSPADTARLIASLQERAEGNPFFLGELLRTLEEEQVLRYKDDRWVLGTLMSIQVPPLLRQVIDGRLSRLGDKAMALFAIAAIIGQEIPLAIWSSVAEADEETLVAVSERAIEAHLISATGTTVRFAHALIREALYESIAPPRRRGWHQRVGTTFATLPNPDPDAVAYHFQQAGDARAVEWLVRAGERAQQAYARLTAADRFDAALALMEIHNSAVRERGWMLLRLALLCRYADAQRALGYLEGAARAATDAGDGLLGAYTRFNQGLVLGYLEEMRPAVAAMEEAVAALDMLFPLDESALRWLERMGMATDPDNHRGTLALWLAHLGMYRRARELGEAVAARLAVTPTTARLDGALAADVFRGLGDVYAALGQPVAARQAYRQNAQAYAAIGDYLQVFVTKRRELTYIVLPYETTDLAGRQQLIDEANEAAARLSGTRTGVPGGGVEEPVHILEGDWHHARQMLLASAVSPGWSRLNTTSMLGPLARQQGDADLAWTLVREQFTDGPATKPGGLRYIEALTLLRLGAQLTLESDNLPSARKWIEAHDRWLEWSGAVLGQSEGQLLWAQYHRHAGDADHADGHAERALAHATEPRQPLALLAAHRLMGELDTDAGRYDDADTHLDAALALADACVAPYERALALLALAVLHHAIGDTGGMAPPLNEAREIFTRLGAKPALARVGQVALGLLTAAKPAYPAGLSAREVDVLRLVAAGLSNAQVAERLFLSPRTVNGHLTAIYTKLNVPSRGAAIRFAVDHGLI